MIFHNANDLTSSLECAVIISDLYFTQSAIQLRHKSL